MPASFDFAADCSAKLPLIASVSCSASLCDSIEFLLGPCRGDFSVF